VTREEILAEPEKYRDVEVIFSTWGMPKFTEEEIRACLPSLRAVFYAAGSVQAFARPHLAAGVRIFSAWASNAVPVAEYTVAQILLANKGFDQFCRAMSQGDHKGAKAHFHRMPGNYGARVGIIGAGMIGKMVLRRLRDYRLETVVCDPFLSEEQAAELGAKKVSLEELFETCAVISNHVANLPATKGMLRYEHFSLMAPNSCFINSGRNGQIDEDGFVRAFREDPSRFAVLDVTDPKEPPTLDHPYFTLPNVYITPHIAGTLGDEKARMSQYMVDECKRLLEGETLLWNVTEKMLETMA
jgi:phosphoglycerate dehydrogenase-like enzyme